MRIIKEDSIFLVLRRHDGTRRFVKTEIRGYEEGSRYIVVFRLGSINGPIRYVSKVDKQKAYTNMYVSSCAAMLHVFIYVLMQYAQICLYVFACSNAVCQILFFKYL